MPPAIHENCYSSAQVCAAAGIGESTLKNWVSRQPQVVLMTLEDRGKGVPLLYSLQRVMQIALVAELVRFGLEPRAAAMAAAGFSDMGDGARGPAELFPGGLTYLIAHRDDAGSLPGECVNILPGTPFLAVRHHFHGAAAAACVEVNAVHARVRAALDAE